MLMAVCCIASPLLRGGEPQWIEIHSPHFSVVTDDGEKRGREVAMRFEQMRAVFAEMVSDVNVNVPTPLQIVAFRNTRELRQFAPMWNGKPTDVAGLYEQGDDRSFILLDLSVENPWSVVFHEYAHQLLHTMAREETEQWFQEGFAEFFATTQIDNKQALVGKVREPTLDILEHAKPIRIVDLIAVRKDSATYNDAGDRRSAFYAESEMLVHYLYDHDLILKLEAYFDLRKNEHASIEDAIHRAFGMSPAQLDIALREYVRAGKFKGYPVTTPANIVPGEYSAEPVSAAQASAIQADIHLNSPDYRHKAALEFQDVLEADPNNATAWRGLGYIAYMAQQYDEAARRFRRAEELDPSDPRVHYYSALLMQGQGVMTDRSRLPEMIKELEAAVALDPNFAQAYGLLGYARFMNGDPERGLATMRKGLARDPHNEALLYRLAMMYMDHRDFDTAIGLYEVLTRSQDPQMASRASQVLASARKIRDSFVANAPFERHTVDEPIDSDDDKDEDQPRPAASPVKDLQARDAGKIQFMQGTLTAVDCSAAPAAVITVTSGSTTWKLTAPDSQHVVVLGADAFSCSWRDQKVALNYVQTGPGVGRIVSLEIQ